MLRSTPIIRSFIWMFIGSLLTALLIPLAVRSSWAGQQNITLAAGDQITVNCPNGVDGSRAGSQNKPVVYRAPPTAAPTVVAGPAITSFTSVQDGQSLSGKVGIVAQASGNNLVKVVFQLDGPKQ